MFGVVDPLYGAGVTDDIVIGGLLVLGIDGSFDESCGANGRPWNAVYIEHFDGSVAWYGHLKKDSLTSKGIGDLVLAGEYLGIVGSSGSSTGPGCPGRPGRSRPGS